MRTASILVLLASACVTPTKRDLSVLPPVERAVPRACVLAISPIVDARPAAEKVGGRETSLTMLVPTPYIWMSKSSGFAMHEPDTIGGAQMTDALRRGIEGSIGASGLCRIARDPAEATHRLEIQLDHLYALGFTQEQFMMLMLAYAERSVQTFLPVAQAALTARLVSAAGETTFVVAESTAYDPKIDDDIEQAQITNAASGAVARAVALTLHALPPALERALTTLGTAGPAAPADTFRVARLSADRAFVEIGTIDRATGVVRHVAVRERIGPVYSAPGEWVVALDQPHRLTRAQYEALVAELAGRWDVRFDGNLTAATFRGPKALAARTSAQPN